VDSGRAGAFALAMPGITGQDSAMKKFFVLLLLNCTAVATGYDSTIMVVPIFEPLSLHGTDGDDAISEIGEALQASVMPRPMALTGAFPEALVDAIRSPHLIPTNHPNYKVQEANLLVICNIGIVGKIENGVLMVRLNVAELTIPPEVDLTTRQILKLTIIALKKTLEEYQRPQTQALPVNLVIEGADESKASLRDLGSEFTIGNATPPN